MPYAEQVLEEANKQIRLIEEDGYLPKDEFLSLNALKESDLSRLVKSGRVSKERVGRLAFLRAECDITPDEELWPLSCEDGHHVDAETSAAVAPSDPLAGFEFLSQQKVNKPKRRHPNRTHGAPYFIYSKAGKYFTRSLSMPVDLTDLIIESFGTIVCVRSRPDGAVAISAPTGRREDDRAISRSDKSVRGSISVQNHAHNLAFVNRHKYHYACRWDNIVTAEGDSVFLIVPIDRGDES